MIPNSNQLSLARTRATTISQLLSSWCSEDAGELVGEKASVCRPISRNDSVSIGTIAAALCLAIAVLLPNRSCGGGALLNCEALDVQTDIYSDGFYERVAVVRADRIFTENRRLGFFRVKLLPVLVVQGVHLELSQPTPSTNWLGSFRVSLAPFARNSSAVEWRDVGVRLPQDPGPRLQAKQLSPPTKADSKFCLLEGVTLQTDAGPIKVPRARLLLQGTPGQVVWETKGINQQWDLFTRSLISEKPKN